MGVEFDCAWAVLKGDDWVPPEGTIYAMTPEEIAAHTKGHRTGWTGKPCPWCGEGRGYMNEHHLNTPHQTRGEHIHAGNGNLTLPHIMGLGGVNSNTGEVHPPPWWEKSEGDEE